MGRSGSCRLASGLCWNDSAIALNFLMAKSTSQDGVLYGDTQNHDHSDHREDVQRLAVIAERRSCRRRPAAVEHDRERSHERIIKARKHQEMNSTPKPNAETMLEPSSWKFSACPTKRVTHPSGVERAVPFELLFELGDDVAHPAPDRCRR